MTAVDDKLMMIKYGVLENDEHMIDVIEWVDAPWQGLKKQKAEYSTRAWSIKASCEGYCRKVSKIVRNESITSSRIRVAKFDEKIDLTNSHPDIHHVIYTDFGATLDLSAIKAEKCSVNNHAAVCILFVITNWRNVKFKKRDQNGDNIKDKTIINDCDKWIFLQI